MNGKNKASQSDKLINVVIAVVVAAFVVVGVYATYGKISTGIEDKKILNGEKEATVAYLAKQSGMSVEDYLAQYGLSLSDTITEKTTESEMTDNMTIENYLKYTGMEQTADEVIADAGLTETVTKDTLWKDFFPQMPVGMVYDPQTFEQYKTQLSLGDNVTLDMPYGEFEKILEERIKALSEEANADEGEAAADNAQAPAEQPADGGAENAQTTEGE